MAKRKAAKSAAKMIPKYNKKLMTAAGIFAAGSLVGAAVDFSSIPAYFEITTPSSVVTVSDETEAPATETVQTLAAETAPLYTALEEKPQAETYVPVPEATVDIPPEAAPEPVPEPEVTPETPTEPEILPEPAPEPTPVPTPESEQESDWMEAIFIPSTEPSAGSAPEADDVPVSEADDWMDTEWEPPVTEQTQSPAVSAETSSMTEDLAGMLENVAVFWAPSGGKIHLDPSCRSFGTVCFAGTLEEAQTVRTEGWCRWCAEHLDGTDNTVFYVKGNVCATSEQLLRSYTYSDYLNRIPASAFGG